MKRSWRIDLETFPSERDIYASLESATEGDEKVPHLPGCYFGGDVPVDSEKLAADYFRWKREAQEEDVWTPSILPVVPTRTRTADYADEHADDDNLRRRVSVVGQALLTDADIEMLPYILTVTLFRRIGGRLRDFKSTRHLCIALRDALEAHDVAYRLKGVLHRDISEGNILIAKIKGKAGAIEGLLIDWELSVHIDSQGIPRRKSRTGTWAFMSARMLEHPKGFVHDVRDDLESFCHVLYWHVLRMRHTIDVTQKGRLWDVMGKIFNPDESQDTPQSGADEKRQYLRCTTEAINQARGQVLPEGLRFIMADMCTPFGKMYAAPPTELTPLESSNFALRAKYDAACSQHTSTVIEGTNECTAQHFLTMMNTYLTDQQWWVGDSGAQDQYPPHIRKAREDNKDIAKFYRVTEAGVSISRPSEVARAPSMHVARGTEAEDWRAYSRGSGRTPSSTGSGRLSSSREADLDTTTDASDDAEGRARKRQRLSM
ncbi:unnamed protein product [Peniophora sp. CBMAI 1063]|nr:unnamed protein product [Peniophora sp. CBMAI 1063]